MMGCVKCKDCMHWNRFSIGIEKSFNVYDVKKENPMFCEGKGKQYKLPFGNCASKMLVYGEGYHVEAGNGDIHLEDDKALYYMDSECYSAYHVTGANFGCIHGEWK